MKTPVKERREVKKLREDSLNKALTVLAKYNKKPADKSKKKDYYYFIKKLGDLYLSHKVVRPPEEWVCRSYNEDRQIDSFVRHIYCKYNVPEFIRGIFNKNSILYKQHRRFGREHNPPGKLIKESLNMFFTLANGESFYKATSHLFSKKEAHIFVTAGKRDLSIVDNFWLAKIMANGGDIKLYNACRDFFVNELVHRDSTVPIPATMNNSVQFFCRFSDQISRSDLVDLKDFIYQYIRTNHAEFSFKGRTFSSLIKASNVWHKEMHNNHYVRNGDIYVARHRSFVVSHVKDFAVEASKKTGGKSWKISQILNSDDLYKEGRRMHHCVGSYVNWCTEGDSYIFSVTNNVDGNIATVELGPTGAVRQARGKMNSSIDNETREVIKWWLEANKVTSISRL